MSLSINVQVPQSLIDAVDEYQTRFHDKRERFLPISEVYALFPEEGRAARNWPEPWPCVLLDGKWLTQGVYFMFDAHMALVYIGKASFGSDFFKRFVSHFSGSTKTPCTIKDAKLAAVKYVATLCMKDVHDAPSLEEFLIAKFASRTLINSVGNRHNPRR